ncbi:SDR family NAD(P)-dependent oxidoreductase [Streptomyces afghaniensis]|uniref:SDR family NAD(P)-dependent oxidoreductase n=1 Tax=Streptomyces afghaniensis TaxID=66865 RepID=UPI0037A8E85E
MQLDNTSAIVTGAASGLGHAVARALASEGVRVCGLDLAAAVETAQAAPGITYTAADITDVDDVERAVALAADAGPLRTVVNCAGVAPSARILGRHGVHDLPLYARVVGVNLVGTFNVMALAARAGESPHSLFRRRVTWPLTASVSARSHRASWTLR